MLNFDNIVKINLHIDNTANDAASYENGLIIGKSTVIGDDDRIVRVKRLSELQAMGFSDSNPEYVAAKKYFAQKPVPTALYVARRGASEALVDVVKACLDVTGDFWGIMTCGANTDDYTALDNYLMQIDHCMQFVAINGTANALTFATQMTAKATHRTMVMQATESDDAAALLGRVCGLIRSTKQSSFSICYKALEGVTPVAVSEADVEALHAQNGAVYVTRGYSRDLLDGASTGSGLRMDEVLYLDMISSDIQDALVNIMIGENGRLPMADSTTTRFMNGIATVLENYYGRNVLGSGVWRGESIGDVEAGDVLAHGYAMHADPYFVQSDDDHAAHKAMPITVLLTLAGAVESVEINVYAQ